MPANLRESALGWLAAAPASASGFEIAHRLLAMTAAGSCEREVVDAVNQLLDLGGAGGWRGSSFLLVPPRAGGPQPPPNPELRGLLSTAICVQVLSEWTISERQRTARGMALAVVPHVVTS